MYTPTKIEDDIYKYFNQLRKKNEKLLKLLELELRGRIAVNGYEYSEVVDRLQLEHEKIIRMNKAMSGF